jgi:hypothetical protein
MHFTILRKQDMLNHHCLNLKFLKYFIQRLKPVDDDIQILPIKYQDVKPSKYEKGLYIINFMHKTQRLKI